GEGLIDHPDPPNRSIRVRSACSAEPSLPTAQDSLLDTKAAPLNSPPVTAGAAAGLSEPHREASVRLAPVPGASGIPANASDSTTSPNAGRLLRATINKPPSWASG